MKKKPVAGTWEKQKEWYGNPSLGYECWRKVYTWYDSFRQCNRKIPVFIFGKDTNWNGCVSAGANDDLSHSFCHYPTVVTSVEQMMQLTDEQFSQGRLIS